MDQSGVTIHWVDSGVDTGKVIKQVRVPRFEGDTLDTFETRIHEAEYKLYPEVLDSLGVARKQGSARAEREFSTVAEKELLKRKRKNMTKRALISVSDKAGIVEFAQELKNLVGISSLQVGPRLPLTMLG